MRKLTTEDIELLTSLPSSEFRKLLAHISRTDEKLAAYILSEISSSRLVTNDKGEVAAFFDVSIETIDLWQRKGMPVDSRGKGVRGWYDLQQCAAWMAAQRPSVGKDDTEADNAAAAYRDEKRRIVELQRRKLEGELVSATEYRENLMHVVSLIRQGVEQFHRSFGNEGVEMLSDLMDEVETALFRG